MKLKLFLLCAVMACSIPASAVRIRSSVMVVGGEALDVINTRQLTTLQDGIPFSVSISPDGRIIAAYLLRASSPEECAALVSAEGGRLHDLADEPMGEDTDTVGESWTPICHIIAAWSPDGKYLAVPFIHDPGAEAKKVQGIALFNRSGVRLRFLAIDNGSVIAGRAVWNQNSQSLAVLERSRDEVSKKWRQAVKVFTASTGDAVTLQLQREDLVRAELDHWTADGIHLAYIAHIKNYDEMRDLGLDGSDTLVTQGYKIGVRSPDGQHAILQSGMTMQISGLLAGSRQIPQSVPGAFISWSPNGKMFLYGQVEKVIDEIGRQKTPISSLRLRSLEESPMNNLMVFCGTSGALPVTDAASCSLDCTRIAYIAQDSVYVAELMRRAATPYEKLAAKIPLSEEEVKEVVRDNAKCLAAVLISYCQDWDGNWPGADAMPDALQPYFPDDSYPELLNKPGSGANIFNYQPAANWNSLEDPAGTIIGSMDAGYGWITIIYADGHVVTRPK